MQDVGIYGIYGNSIFGRSKQINKWSLTGLICKYISVLEFRRSSIRSQKWDSLQLLIKCWYNTWTQVRSCCHLVWLTHLPWYISWREPPPQNSIQIHSLLALQVDEQMQDSRMQLQALLEERRWKHRSRQLTECSCHNKPRCWDVCSSLQWQFPAGWWKNHPLRRHTAEQ